MGRSKAEKAESHERIVQIAAARFRELGVEGVGVAELMKQAGLTHGGFYRHFASRDDLVAEGVERALHDGAQGAFDAEARGASDRKALLFSLIDWYLGVGHRDGLASGCAVASLAADVSRGSARIRSAYTNQLAAYLDLFVRLMDGDEPRKTKRLKAVAAWATMVGAVSLARAVSDDKLSREILKTAADRVKDQLA